MKWRICLATRGTDGNRGSLRVNESRLATFLENVTGNAFLMTFLGLAIFEEAEVRSDNPEVRLRAEGCTFTTGHTCGRFAGLT